MAEKILAYLATLPDVGNYDLRVAGETEVAALDALRTEWHRAKGRMPELFGGRTFDDDYDYRGGRVEPLVAGKVEWT